MTFGKKRHRRHKIPCPQCFAYIRADSRKCQFCGYTFKSAGKYWVDKIKHVLKIDRAFSVSREKSHRETQNFFTPREIEKLTRLENLHILMFMRLDDISLLDEMALIELGETLIMMNKH
jgi:tRNA G26 N,N-dimethylase Trm1